MKSYFLATVLAFIGGWVAQTIACATYILSTSGSSNSAAALAGLAVCFLMFSLIANILFIQLPSSFIKKLFFKTNTIVFAILLAIYGLAIFTLTLGLVIQGSTEENTPFYLSSLVNGFAFGLIFHFVWKPNQINA